MKNDITYEYRVFTNRLIDIEAMEVGKCTSKVVKELKPKDKVDGRFFHTSDTDEWFFCWNGELQKLNLKGNSDVNDALSEVEKLIADAKIAVNDAKKTADEAKEAASEAKNAADAASAAVESIDSKAEQSDVDELSKVVVSLSQVVESKANKSDIEELSANVALKSDLDDIVKTSELDGYATKEDIKGKQDVIEDLDDIRTNMGLAKTALQSIPEEYVTKTELEGKGYLTVDDANSKYAPIGSTSSGVAKDYVDTELAKKQDIIDDIDEIRSNAALAATALQEGDLEGYVTEDELNKKGYLTEHQDISGKQNVIENLDDIISGAALGATALQPGNLEGYVTEDELNKKGYLTEHQDISGKQDVIENLNDIISGAAAGATALQPGDLEGYLTENSNVIVGINSQIADINALLGEAVNITNTILA